MTIKTQDAIEETKGFREICPKGKQRRETAMREPMVEGIAEKVKWKRFASGEISFIKQVWIELSARGLKDGQIKKEIAKEKGWSANSVYAVIKRLRKKKEIGENPNKLEKFATEEIDFIKLKRTELSTLGLKDQQIAREIAKGKEWKTNSVQHIIRRLRKNKEINENSNKREKFKPHEISYIIKKWSELSSRGVYDSQIHIEIAKEKGWKARSIGDIIRRLRKNNEIGENPKKREVKRYGNEEISFIKQRWIDFSSRGMKDEQISRVIAKEKGWKIVSIGCIIKRLRKNKEIDENPNKQEQFASEEINFIKQRWIELSAKGMKDPQISRVIAKEKGWKNVSIISIIKRLQKNKEIDENPNKQEKRVFSNWEINYIKQRWIDFSSRGMNDRQIHKEIAKEKGWKARSIGDIIRRLRKKKEIGDNPNKRDKREFSNDEIGFIKRKWIDLSKQGMKDEKISKEIAKEKGWNAGSISGIVRRLRKNKDIGENPNKVGAGTSQNELLSGLRQAPEAMEKFGEGK